MVSTACVDSMCLPGEEKETRKVWWIATITINRPVEEELSSPSSPKEVSSSSSLTIGDLSPSPLLPFGAKRKLEKRSDQSVTQRQSGVDSLICLTLFGDLGQNCPREIYDALKTWFCFVKIQKTVFPYVMYY